MCGLCCLKSRNVLLHTRGALGVYSLLSLSGYSYLDFSFFSWYKSTQLHRSRLHCGNLSNSICQSIQVLFLSSVWLPMAIPLSHHELSPLYHFWVLQFHGVFWGVHFKPVKGHAIESVWFDKLGTSSWYGRDETYSTIRQPDRWGGPLLVKQLGVTVVVLDLENVLVDVAWCVIHRVLHPRFDLEYRWQFLH